MLVIWGSKGELGNNEGAKTPFVRYGITMNYNLYAVGGEASRSLIGSLTGSLVTSLIYYTDNNGNFRFLEWGEEWVFGRLFKDCSDT